MLCLRVFISFILITWLRTQAHSCCIISIVAYRHHCTCIFCFSFAAPYTRNWRATAQYLALHKPSLNHDIVKRQMTVWVCFNGSLLYSESKHHSSQWLPMIDLRTPHLPAMKAAHFHSSGSFDVMYSCG